MDHRKLITLLLLSSAAPLLAETPNNPEILTFKGAKKKAAITVKSLFMANKSHDPFGLNQDPNAQPIKAKLELPTPDLAKAPKIALAKEILKLKSKIQGIGVNQMIIGARMLRRGDNMSVIADTKTFKLRIMKITPEEIHFLNTEDNGIITLDMKRDKIFDSSSGPRAIPTADPKIEL